MATTRSSASSTILIGTMIRCLYNLYHTSGLSFTQTLQLPKLKTLSDISEVLTCILLTFILCVISKGIFLNFLHYQNDKRQENSILWQHPSPINSVYLGCSEILSFIFLTMPLRLFLCICSYENVMLRNNKRDNISL